MTDIQREYEDSWGDKFTIPQHSNENHPSYNSLGGSELYTINLFKHVPKEVRDGFNIVVSRYVPEVLDDNKPSILICQDLYNDPMYDHLRDGGHEKFERIVFVSHWQREMFQRYNYGIPLEKVLTVHNAVMPVIDLDKVEMGVEGSDAKFRIAYTSTPQRGLAVLLEACRLLYEQRRQDFEVDVYSSFKIYGFEKNDEPFLPLFEKMKETEWVNHVEHMDNADLRRELGKTHIWCLPSIWEETSCMAMMEAMHAGCLNIACAYGALPETSAGFGIVYDTPPTPETHIQRLAGLIDHAMNTYTMDGTKDMMNFQRAYADRFYTWRTRGRQWQALLASLKAQLEGASEAEVKSPIKEEETVKEVEVPSVGVNVAPVN